MLPGELLAVWKRKGEIFPRYAKFSSENLGIVDSLIDAYKKHVGEKKKVLKAFVADLEDWGCEYRFVRGLAVILDRRCIFKCHSEINPVDVRRKVFAATEKFGLATSCKNRQKIVDCAALELGLPAATVEDNLYADLDDELELDSFAPLPASELLGRYNLSLTQTLLFDSTELKFTVSGNWQQIFYAIKKLGLIYEVQRETNFWVKIDGPASLFKLTRRYGTGTAKLLPVIIANAEWTIEAKILWKYTNEICDFKIESRKQGQILKKPDIKPVTYDSTVEENFAQFFKAMKSGWFLKREPEPVQAGNQILIPDFSFEREGTKVYFEIVGFWTQDYLSRKIEKLKKTSAKMLIAVDKNLACEKLSSLDKHSQLNLIYYHDKIPLAPVLRYLDEAFVEIKKKQVDFLKDFSVTFTEDVVNFDEFASQTGVSIEAAREVLTGNPPTGYSLLPNGLVRAAKLEALRKRVEERLNNSEKLFLPEATRIFESEGIVDVASALDAIGYKVEWHGINADQAKVTRK